MKILIDKSFENDIKKLKEKKLLSKIADVLEEVQYCNSIHEIKNLKKLKGKNNYFRIRIGNFRLGLSIEKDSVIFIRFLSRKDIYKFFP